MFFFVLKQLWASMVFVRGEGGGRYFCCCFGFVLNFQHFVCYCDVARRMRIVESISVDFQQGVY